MNIVIHLLGIF